MPLSVTSPGGASMSVDVSVIIVNFNTSHLLSKCLHALGVACQGMCTEVVIVDNASVDDSVQQIRRDWPEVRLIENACNVGFGRANNQALPYCHGRYVLLLNTDAFVESTAVWAALRCLKEGPGIGIVGARLSGRDGELQRSWRFFPTAIGIFATKTGLTAWLPKAALVDPPGWQPDQSADCDWVPGCFLMIRRSIVQELGLFDPRFFLYYEEVDLCRRVQRAGWRVRYLADARVVHIGGESAKSVGKISPAGRQLPALHIESQLLFFRKHTGLLGLVWHVALESLAASIEAVKRTLRRRPQTMYPLQEFWLLLRLLVRTSAGERPTR